MSWYSGWSPSATFWWTLLVLFQPRWHVSSLLCRQRRFFNSKPLLGFWKCTIIKILNVRYNTPLILVHSHSFRPRDKRAALPKGTGCKCCTCLQETLDADRSLDVISGAGWCLLFFPPICTFEDWLAVAFTCIWSACKSVPAGPGATLFALEFEFTPASVQMRLNNLSKINNI